MNSKSPLHYLRVDPDSREQRPEDTSFVGGYPRLPTDFKLPLCAVCGSHLSFFLQVAFPDDHVWSGRSLAVFACTSCANEEHLIPQMLSQQLCGASIPDGFLDQYQRNFRFLVFATSDGVLRMSYWPRVEFRRLRLEVKHDNDAHHSKVGGAPTWILDDESPSSYGEGTAMHFLLQWQGDYLFRTIANAPPQVTLGLDGRPTTSTDLGYQLFLGNELYLFGTDPKTTPRIYAITQCD